MTAALTLASTSRYRRSLLERLEVEFEVAAPDFDEATLEPLFESLDDASFATRLAKEKAHSLRSKVEGFILAADQIATVDLPPRTLLHKPGDEARAVEQLMILRGREHVLTTGVVLLETATGRELTAVDAQVMTMRAFERDEAEAYVSGHRPLDCVGAYRIEDAGIRLFERMQGQDYTGIIGLPLLAVARLLRQAGLM